MPNWMRLESETAPPVSKREIQRIEILLAHLRRATTGAAGSIFTGVKWTTRVSCGASWTGCDNSMSFDVAFSTPSTGWSEAFTSFGSHGEVGAPLPAVA